MMNCRWTCIIYLLIGWTFSTIKTSDEDRAQLPEHINRDRKLNDQLGGQLQNENSLIRREKARRDSNLNNLFGNEITTISQLVRQKLNTKSEKHVNDKKSMSQNDLLRLGASFQKLNQVNNRLNLGKQGARLSKKVKDNYSFQEKWVEGVDLNKFHKNEIRNKNLSKQQLKKKHSEIEAFERKRINVAVGRKHVKNELKNEKGLGPEDAGQVHKGKNLEQSERSRSGQGRDQLIKNGKNSQRKSKNVTSLIHRLKPQQIHISFASKMNDIVIMWATFEEEECGVMYTTNVNGLIVNEGGDYKKQGSTRVEMTMTNTRGAQYIYRSELGGLNPGMQYSYYIKCKHDSDLFSFTVPSLKKHIVHSYMILADMGTETKNLQYIVSDAQKGYYDAVFHIGDIAYDLGLVEGKEQIGDKFLNMIQPMAANVPYITIAGDHERFNNYADYRYRFSNPGVLWPQSDLKLWYSFDAGLAHFVCILTQVFSELHTLVPKMMEWLSQDLLMANRNRVHHPWIIVMGHHPMYCSGDTAKNFPDDCADSHSIVRNQLEDVLNLHGVDLYISGHAHFYERTWPVLRNRVMLGHYKDPDAVVHLTVGALGIQYLERKVLHSGGSWSAYYKAGKEIYGKLDVINETHLHWKAVDAKTQYEIDTMMLIQSFHGPFIEGRELHKVDPNPEGVYVYHVLEQSYQRDLYNYCLYLFYFISFGGLLCLFMFRKRIKLCVMVLIK